MDFDIPILAWRLFATEKPHTDVANPQRYIWLHVGLFYVYIVFLRVWLALIEAFTTLLGATRWIGKLHKFDLQGREGGNVVNQSEATLVV